MNIRDYNGPDAKLKLHLRQLLTALGPLMGIIVSGMSNGYSAILLPQLKTVSSGESLLGTADHFGPLTIDQESWIAASAVLPMAPGCWTGGFLADRFGRRTSVLLLFPIFFVGWLTIGFANSVNMLVAGRFLVGFCVGILAPIVPIYVGETSDPLLRGILLGAIGLTLSFGVLVCHAIGTWLHWRTTAHICSMIPVICWIICIFSRESPIWLLSKDKLEQARHCWIFFRGERSLEEFCVLENTKLTEISGEDEEYSICYSFRKTWSSQYFLRPLAIICLYFFTLQFAGANVMSFYCVEMLADVSSRAYAYLITLVIDAIRLTFSVLACILMKTCHRRTMTFISGFGVAVTMLSLSTCLMLDIGRPWLLVALLVIYVALLPLGLFPIPWLLCGELFPRKFRGLGSGLTTGFSFICFFMVIKMLPTMIELIKLEGAFAVYGSVALIGTSILYFVLPETKNKTLQEIQVYFNRKSRVPKTECLNTLFSDCSSCKVVKESGN